MGSIKILSRSPVVFNDRHHAGKLIAEKLSEYKNKSVVVLGVPRGGMIVAYEIAVSLNAELDLVLAHKLGTPGHEELAMGSVSENGYVFLNRDIIAQLRISENSINVEKNRQFNELNRRAAEFRKIKPKIPLKGRTAIVADDGVATGATTQAALWAVREEKPEKLIAAIPVGPEDTINGLADAVDEIICLSSPMYFSAVGQFYHSFHPVDEEEVIDILEKYKRKPG